MGIIIISALVGVVVVVSDATADCAGRTRSQLSQARGALLRWLFARIERAREATQPKEGLEALSLAPSRQSQHLARKPETRRLVTCAANLEPTSRLSAAHLSDPLRAIINSIYRALLN